MLCLSPALRLRLGLGASGAAAFLTLLPLNGIASIAIAMLIGAGLSLLTVTLVTHLSQWCGDRDHLLKIGAGTGLGYLPCNIPPFFSASPQVQAATAGLLCIAGILISPPNQVPYRAETISESTFAFPFPFVVACFAALVWLDSAAFFIIQNTATLKAGTWQGTAHLWTNGLLHLGAALGSAWLLRRRGLSFVLSGAFFLLAYACLLLLDPLRIPLAAVLYPVGVSLYSVALVAYPSLLSPAASVAERGRQAGWLYAIAGWAASALGIGMGQNLGHVPSLFVAGAGAVVLFPMLQKAFLQRRRELLVVSSILLVGFVVDRIQRTTSVSASLTSVERGRQVYISEGCINCHSQYVRPDTRDVEMWGPTESLAATSQPAPAADRQSPPGPRPCRSRRPPLAALAQDALLQSSGSKRRVHHALLWVSVSRPKRQRSGCISRKPAWTGYARAHCP